MASGKEEALVPAGEDDQKEAARGTRRKRRGLGALGQQAWQQGVPEMVLLPRRDTFTAAEVTGLCDVKAATLRRWERQLPQLAPSAGPGGARVYSRAQVELLLRIKQMVEREGLSLDEVRRRVGEASGAARGPAPPPSSRPPETTRSGAGPVPSSARTAAEEALSQAAQQAAGGHLPDAAVSYLRAELAALLGLCQDEPEQALPPPLGG